MTAIAIATLVTSIIAVAASIVGVSEQQGSTAYQRALFFGGIFGLIWSVAYLMGA